MIALDFVVKHSRSERKQKKRLRKTEQPVSSLAALNRVVYNRVKQISIVIVKLKTLEIYEYSFYDNVLNFGIRLFFDLLIFEMVATFRNILFTIIFVCNRIYQTLQSTLLFNLVLIDFMAEQFETVSKNLKSQNNLNTVTKLCDFVKLHPPHYQRWKKIPKIQSERTY